MVQKSTSVKKFESLDLNSATVLKLGVWKIRSSVRSGLGGYDLLNVEKRKTETGKRIRHFYRSIDKFMVEFFPSLAKTTSKKVALAWVRDMIDDLGYTVVEADENRPWGAYYRLDDQEAGRFIHEFFPGLSLHDAKLGHTDVKLSPKFLIVAPGERLSWQFHHRRAERWRFLTDGAYYASDTDKQGAKLHAKKGDIIQLAQGERHRLSTGKSGQYVLVAEIWQHTDPSFPSEESDIVRLSDDYKRVTP